MPSRWWFQIFFIFTPTWGRFPFSEGPENWESQLMTFGAGITIGLWPSVLRTLYGFGVWRPSWIFFLEVNTAQVKGGPKKPVISRVK